MLTNFVFMTGALEMNHPQPIAMRLGELLSPSSNEVPE
jgi:hypothetical protein